MTTYTDTDGCLYFVSQGIGGADGPWFAVKQRRYGQSLKRVKSPNLPDRPTQAEAQADLDAYAEKHGWEADTNNRRPAITRRAPETCEQT